MGTMTQRVGGVKARITPWLRAVAANTVAPGRSEEDLPTVVARERRWISAYAGVILLALAATFFGATILRTRTPIYQDNNTYFGGDTRRVVQNMTDLGSDHHRTSVHPLFPLMTYPVVTAMRSAVGLTAEQAVALVLTLNTGLVVIVFLLVTRAITGSPVQAIVYTGLFLSSAAAVFWLPAPDTFAFGGLTLLIPALVAVLPRRWCESNRTLIAVSALTASVTVTNLMAGGLLALFTKGWKQAPGLVLKAVIVVTVLWGVQKYFAPSAKLFVGDNRELDFLVAQPVTRYADVFFTYSRAIPGLRTGGIPGKSPRVDIVRKRVWSTRTVVTHALWLGVLGIGVVNMARFTRAELLARLVGGVILGQFVLHLVYGKETFLYAMHYTPYLCLAASYAARSRWRWPCLGAALLLTLLSVRYNLAMFAWGVEILSGPPVVY